MNYDEALSLMSDLTTLVLETLKVKYGEKILQDICARGPLYPLAGTALMLSKVEPPPCDDLSQMIKEVLNAPQYMFLSLSEGCEADARNMVSYVLNHFQEICKKSGASDALKYLSKEALKIGYLDEVENDVLLNLLAYIPQLLYYAKEQGIDVSKDVLQAHSHVINFIIREINEIGGSRTSGKNNQGM